MDERELNIQRAIFTLQKRLSRSSRVYRQQMRYSCMWATDEEFQRILDSLVANGVAVRESGERGGESYRGVAHAK
jgi:hypothetical protein